MTTPSEQPDNPYASPQRPDDSPSSKPARRLNYREIQRLQGDVNVLLARACVFAILWLCGAGSVYSIWLAYRANRLIATAPNDIRGLGRVWFCWIVGASSLLLLALILAGLA